MIRLALKSLKLLLVVLIVLTLLAASPVSAADKGLKVQGAILSRNVSPGQNLTHTMTVSIGTDDEATDITVRLGEFGQSLNGAYELLETAPNPDLSACPFITLDKESFHLEPGGSEVVTATIQIPADVGAGGRYALINIKTGATDGGGVGTISAVNVPIALIIKDTTLLRQGEITALDIEVAEGQKLNIDTIFHNTGNYHFRIQGNITISKFQGQTLKTIPMPLTSGSIIPEMSLRLNAKYEPEAVLAKGIYIVKSQVMAEDGTVLAEKMAAFQVTDSSIVILPEVPEEGKPFNWLLLAVIISVVAIGLVIFFLRRRRRRYAGME
jgi:hypothetical protein